MSIEYIEQIIKNGNLVRIFQGKKYWLDSGLGRYVGNRIRGKGGSIFLSHAIWNYHHPDDLVLKGEDVHHKNESPIDDDIENYEKISHGEHSRIHKIGKKRKPFTDEAKRNMSLCRVGVKLSEDHKKKIGLGQIGRVGGFAGKIHDEKTKERIRFSNIGQKRSEEAKQNMRDGRKNAKERRLA